MTSIGLCNSQKAERGPLTNAGHRASAVILLICSVVISAEIPTAEAQLVVHLDFTSDTHDGAGGGANGTADWIDELNQATASAGVSNFDASERSTIQSTIQSQLETIYADYSITFTTAAPGSGSFDTLNFGVEASAGVLGFAPLDIGNLSNSQTTNVAPETFGFFIESS